MDDMNIQQLLSMLDEIGRKTQALAEENAALKLENTHLRDENNQLATENKELKNKVRLQAPLVESGVLIRRRFFEHMKEQRGLGEANRSIIEAGNGAAHEGDCLADVAMFKLGFMKSPEFVASQEKIETTYERTYKILFYELYGTALGEMWTCVSQPEILSVNILHYWNLYGSMSASSPFMDEEGDDPDAQAFKELGDSCVEIVSQASQGGIFTLKDTIDNHPVMESNLIKMRDIVRRAVQNNRRRRRSGNFEGRDISAFR